MELLINAEVRGQGKGRGLTHLKQHYGGGHSSPHRPQGTEMGGEREREDRRRRGSSHVTDELQSDSGWGGSHDLFKGEGLGEKAAT